jgi:sec-independent protein translocase protein TatA
MGIDNPLHIAFLLILLLLVFGAKRLPEMGRSLGTGLRGFKDALGGEGAQSPFVAEQHAATTASEATAIPVTTAPAAASPVASVPSADAAQIAQMPPAQMPVSPASGSLSTRAA